MPPSQRLPKYVRDMSGMLRRLGYKLDRNAGGHYIYVKPGFAPFVIAGTSSDVRSAKNATAELRRRHPNHPVFRRRKAAQRRRRARRNKQTAVALRFSGPERESIEFPAPPATSPRFEAAEPITAERRDEWRKKADELARLNAESRFPWRKAA